MNTKFYLLRYRIAEARMNQGDFAATIGLNKQTLSNRMCGHTPWSVQEAFKACDVLGLDYSEIGKLFSDCKECVK